MSHASRQIHIEYGAALASLDEQQTANDCLGVIVRDLLADHGIDVTYSLVFSEQKMTAHALSIRVDDQALRIVHQQSILSWREPRSLATQVAESLFANRAMLLPADYVQQLWDKWIGNGEQAPAGFLQLLTNLITRGISIGRLDALQEQLRSCEKTADGFDAIFETVLAGVQGQRIRILISPQHYQQLYDAHGDCVSLDGEYGNIDEILRMAGNGLFYDLGIIYRLDHVEADDSLDGMAVRLKVNDLRTPELPGLEANEFLVNDSVDRLTLLNIKGSEAINPANGSEASIVNDTAGAQDICEQASLTTWDAHGCMILMASHIIRRFAGALLSTDIVDFMLQRLATTFPDLVARTEQVYSHRQLAQVLRNLLDEEISVRDLRSILESLLAYRGAIDIDLHRYIVFHASPGTVAPSLNTFSGETLQSQQLTECVRIELKRVISHKYTRGGNTLVVYLLDPQIETRLAESRMLELEKHKNLIAAIETELGGLPVTAQSPVILTTADIRARLRYEVEKEFPNLAVLSYQELNPDMNIQPVARIEWDAEVNGLE